MAVVVASSGTFTPPLGTITVTIASPAVFSYTGHQLTAGDAVSFQTTGALPTGLTAGTTYYVIAAGLTANAFEVSTTPGGSAVNTSGSQSGTHSIIAEHVLYDTAGTGIYVVMADLSNMASGDQVRIQIYRMALSGGTRVLVLQDQYNDAQTPPDTRPPLANVSKDGAIFVQVETGLGDTGAVRFTLSQVAGSARAFPWTVDKTSV